MRDRFFDLHVNTPMGKIVTDKLRSDGQHDVFGVQQARAQLRTAYAIAESWLREAPGSWVVGDAFTMADCAAAPALFFARQVEPLGDEVPYLARYYERLTRRASVKRVFDEAQPYLAMFPG
jgi:glutathione S-transferase